MNFDVKFTEQTKPIEGAFGDKVVVVAGGGAKEEWIDIADITTTEDVCYVFFDKDINGNPFECKEIIAKVITPNPIKSIYTSTLENFWGGAWSGTNLITWAEVKEVCVKQKVTIGQFTEFEFLQNSHSGEENSFNSFGECGRLVLYKAPVYKETIKGFRFGTTFENTENENILSAGTQIKIWGLKA